VPPPEFLKELPIRALPTPTDLGREPAAVYYPARREEADRSRIGAQLRCEVRREKRRRIPVPAPDHDLLGVGFGPLNRHGSPPDPHP